MKTLSQIKEEYYARANGSTSPTDFVDYLVAQGKSKTLSIEVMFNEFDLEEDEEQDWLHKLKCSKIDLLWNEIQDTANALGLSLSGNWSNHSDEYNIDVSF